MNKSALRISLLMLALIISGCGVFDDVVDTVLGEDAPADTTTTPVAPGEEVLDELADTVSTWVDDIVAE